MTERPDDSTASARRERRIVMAVVAAIVIVRSAVFVLWQQAHFDADQAITGLMAKHLAELRAFPVFYYGQNYMLGVEAWLAAPLFAVAGASVTALKLPLLAINVAIALMLLRIFERDVGLRPMLAAVPALFFALAAPATTALLLSANGGNVEPLAYVLLLWMTRRRPNWGGVLLGLGFLHREFTVYGFVALLAVEAIQRVLFTRDGIRRRLVMLRAAAEVWLVVEFLKHLSSAAGPGTTFAQVHGASNNVVGLANRICSDLQALPAGLAAMATEHWPTLFGVRVQPLTDFGVQSDVSQGMPLGWVVLAVAGGLALAGVVQRLVAEPAWRREYDACAYLVITAAISVVAYAIGRCGQITFLVMRYELMSLIGLAGLGAWFLRSVSSRVVLRTWVAAACATVAISAFAHARLLAEYTRHAPPGAKRIIATQLEARGIRYAISDYWLAYPLTFLTNERVIVASEDLYRVDEYQRVVDEHRQESIRISRQPCDRGKPIVQAGVYFCPRE